MAWQIKGTNNLYWDGTDAGMTGWTAYGHPYLLYDYLVEHYFTVTVKYVDEKNADLMPQTTELVRAGDAYSLSIPQIANATWTSTEGADNLDAIKNFTVITFHYKSGTTGIASVMADSKEASIYNLQGMKLTKPQKGLNITKGKKFISK